MASMDERFEAACRAEEIAGAVLLAANKSGKLHYAKAFGTRSLKDAESAKPISQDDIMCIASCTKFMTCIAVMQCVESVKLALDDDVSTVLPEVGKLEILTGFDEESGKPTYTRPKNAITLRMLLTHSSGMSYDLFNPILQKWRASQGQRVSPGKTIAERFDCPLLFEPGTAWDYSPSIDWAGKMVERVNGNISLQDYMRTNIWEPLGIKDMTFYLRDREDLRKRLTDMSMRDPTGSGKVIYTPDPGFQAHMKDAMGGSGVFSSPREYIKILQCVLANDGKLLKPESIEEFFKPQLSKSSQQALMELLENPDLKNILGGMPLGTNKDWSLGGLLIMEDMPKWRNKYTMSWAGFPNLTWFIDRKAGLCGMYASQLIPPGDPKSHEMAAIFERAMYEQNGGVAACI